MAIYQFSWNSNSKPIHIRCTHQTEILADLTFSRSFASERLKDFPPGSGVCDGARDYPLLLRGVSLAKLGVEVVPSWWRNVCGKVSPAKDWWESLASAISAQCKGGLKLSPAKDSKHRHVPVRSGRGVMAESVGEGRAPPVRRTTSDPWRRPLTICSISAFE